MHPSAVDVDDREPGAAVLVALPDGRVLRACRGVASVELAAPISTDTVMNAGSVAKQITAHLVIRAARDGVLDLARPVSDLLPRLRPAPVSISELANHHGGIRDAESLLSLAGFRDLDHYTGEDLLELAYRQRERCTKPEQFLYSNTGYLILAKILELVYERPLHQIADKQVFGPLQMTGTRFKTDPRQVIPSSANGYERLADTWLHTTRPVAIPGPGSLWCSVEDLDRWLTHLHAIWLEQPAGSLPLDGHVPYANCDRPSLRYGPGLYANPHPGTESVFHYGHEHGFSAATYLTRTGMRISCTSNRSDLHADHIAARLYDTLRVSGNVDPQPIVHQALATSLSQPSRDGATGRVVAAMPHGSGVQTPVGTYRCDEVPGILRLTRNEHHLTLWRRGTSDELGRIYGCNRVFLGPGYRFTLLKDDDAAGTVHSFRLDLDRAPGLRYVRVDT